jgi:hypothetical protein
MRLEKETHLSTINISSTRIISWMNAIRNSSGKTQYRLLENFWESQLRSKSWMINILRNLHLEQSGDVYIFGGWYGVLGSLIIDNFCYKNVYSIDIDPKCQTIGMQLDNRVKFIKKDMKDFKFDDSSTPKLIINTSTEHISQEIFDTWLNNMPVGVPIVLQGNDYFDCEEHVRCVSSLDEFLVNSNLDKIFYMDELSCEQFNRFMIIGYKYAY